MPLDPLRPPPTGADDTWDEDRGATTRSAPSEGIFATEPSDDDVSFDEVEEANAADRLLGSMAGSYRLMRELGRGGGGTVFEAVHPIIGTRVAVKFLSLAASRKPASVARFFDEARAVNLVAHDNLVRVLDMSSTPDGRHFIVMECLVGEPLSARLKRGPMTLAEAGPIILQICDAMHAIHRKGIVHRDLKPSNVFLTTHEHRANFVKILDFGIAKLRQTRSIDKTRPGAVLGTPRYLSPELAKGDAATVDARSDLYSLAVILYEMLCGRPPFLGDAQGILVMHALEKPTPPSQWVAMPPALETLLLQGLAKAPRERPESMEVFGTRLRAILKAEGLSEDRPVAIDTASVPTEQEVPRVRLAVRRAADLSPSIVTGRGERPAGFARDEGPEDATVPFSVAAPPIDDSTNPAVPIIVPPLRERTPSGRQVRIDPEPAPVPPPAGSSLAMRVAAVGSVIVAMILGVLAWAVRDGGPTVRLHVDTEPPGANIAADAPGLMARGVAPFDFDAPRGARLVIRASLAGHVDAKVIRTATESGGVTIRLAPAEGDAH